MIINVYLHNEIYDLLRCYGELNDVVNRILEDTANAGIDWCDKPACPSKESGGRYEITVTNEEYLAMYNEFGPNSPKISLRRLIYWFVDNELYDEFGWEPTRDYINSYKKAVDDRIERIVTELSRLKRQLVEGKRIANIPKIEDIITQIIALRL